MANVNPPPALKMPRIILEDREWRDYERDRDTILFQLWQRTGGNTDEVEESKNNITSSSSRVPISITLDPQAVEDDEVHIKRRGVSIEVIGSIDGFTNKTINLLNYSMHLIFDGTDWSEI